MALKQIITSISGAVTEYHRVSHITLDCNTNTATVSVSSYVALDKRQEEKDNLAQENNRNELMDELNKLVADPTEENEARRIDLSNQINDLPISTPADHEPRNLFETTHEISVPAGTDFSLAFVYEWLKDNVYTKAEDC